MAPPPDARRDNAPALERRIEGGVTVLRTPDAEARIERPAPNVVLARLRGRHTEAMAQALTDEIDGVIQREGPIDNFYDGWQQDSHDPPIRTHWQSWAERQKPSLRSVHMLIRPKNSIATMAITVANMLIGGTMTLHTTQAAFDAALTAACAARRGRP